LITLGREDTFPVAQALLFPIFTRFDEITGIRDGDGEYRMNLSSVGKQALEHVAAALRNWVLFTHPFAGVAPRTAQLHTLWHAAIQDIAPQESETNPGKGWLQAVKNIDYSFQ